MPSDFLFAAKSVSLSKLAGRKPCSLFDAARHNRRAIQAEVGAGYRIDPERTRYNETIAGPATPEAVEALANQIAVDAGIDLATKRRDRCQAIELVFSLPADGGLSDDGAYFRRCLSWVGSAFPRVAVLSADIHRDEAAPHCHVLLSPIQDGQLVGGTLIVRAELVKLRESFWRSVAGPAGMKRGDGRMYGAVKAAGVAAVIARLEAIQAAELRGPLWPLTRNAIERDPLPYLQSLGIDPQSLRLAPLKRATSNPIGIATPTQQVDAKDQSLSCVGIDHPTTSNDHPETTPSEADGGVRITRQRDRDLMPEAWCDKLGEFIKTTTPATAETV